MLLSQEQHIQWYQVHGRLGNFWLRLVQRAAVPSESDDRAVHAAYHKLGQHHVCVRQVPQHEAAGDAFLSQYVNMCEAFCVKNPSAVCSVVTVPLHRCSSHLVRRGSLQRVLHPPAPTGGSAS
jgi:hypothetical protein